MNSNTKQLNSMSISKERLAQFATLFKIKTGRILPEQEVLVQAERLLRMISIIYKPVDINDFCSALTKKLIIRRKRLFLLK